jgi:prevent-host-death family protein
MLVMERVSVATLKSKLSQYLEAVKKGKEIIVTSHQHPVARLLPVEKSPAALEIAAPAIRPISSLREIKGTKLKFDPVDYLLEDRRRR